MLKAKYHLKRIKKSSDSNLTETLILYSKNIQPHLRTDSNQIIYCLDEYNNKFDDEFFILNFSLNNVIIGYIQFVYFTIEKTIFIDYIVIESEYRKNNTFYQFIEQVREFLVLQNIEFDYVVAEVGSIFEGKELPENDRQIVRLLKLSSFKVAKIDYFHPEMGRQIGRNLFQSVLMIHSGNDQCFLEKETYKNLIEMIYFKHYLRWYSLFLTDKDLALYGRSIQMVYDITIDKLSKLDRIEINGTNALVHSPKMTSKKSSKNLLVWASTILIVVVLISIFGAIHLLLKNIFGIETSAQYYIFLLSIAIMVLVIVMRTEKHNRKLSDIVKKMLRID